MANPTGKGGFKKGVSGNPSGRPHMLSAIAPMARRHSAAAIRTLVEIAEKGSPDSARIAAAVALLDRGFGAVIKPSQLYKAGGRVAADRWRRRAWVVQGQGHRSANDSA